MVWREDFHGCATSCQHGAGLHDGLVVPDGHLKVILGGLDELDVSPKLVDLILVVGKDVASLLFLHEVD